MDVLESVRRWVLCSLPVDRDDAELAAHLNGLNAHDLLVVYHNWMCRLIPARPRRVHMSATLQARMDGSPHAPALREIIGDIEAGRNLTKYLSRGIAVAAQIPRNDTRFNRRRDLDLMLTSWQMHHLHLSANEEGDGFVSRTGDLLFAVFRADDAYLVDVMPHGNWSSDHLLRVALDELPDARAAHVLRGVVGLSRNPSEAEHQQLRNATINAPRMIGDRAVMPAGVMSTAGTSLQATRAADRVISLLEGFEASWADHPEEIRQLYRTKGSELPEEPDFRFTIVEGLGAGIVEWTTKAFFPFPF